MQSDVSCDHGKMPSTFEFGESQSKGISDAVTQICPSIAVLRLVPQDGLIELDV